MRRVMPSELHSCWAWIRKGLEKVPHADDWLPEDVYAALRNDTAMLFVTDTDDGFVVINIINGYDGGKQMHVWIAYNEGSILYEESDKLDALARGFGCNSMTFFTNRKGWAKNRLGYEEVHTLYRKNL